MLNLDGAQAKLQNVVFKDHKYYLKYEQYCQGIPVWNAQMILIVNQEGKIILVKNNFQKILDINITPKIGSETAVNIAKNDFGGERSIQVNKKELFILPDLNDGSLYLSWSIWLQDKEQVSDQKIYFVEANNSDILLIYNPFVNYDIGGTVTTYAWSYPTTDSPDSTPDLDDEPSPYLTITVVGEGTDDTDEDGSYSVAVPSSGSYDVSAVLEGPHAEVTNDAGSDASYSNSASTAAPHDWCWDESAHYNEYNVFYYMNKAWVYFSEISDFSSNWWYNHSMTCYANDGTGSGDGSANGSVMSINPNGGPFGGLIYHEYAHNVLFRARGGWIGPPGGFTDGAALNEGLADYYACSFKNHYRFCYASYRRLDEKLKYWSPGPPYDNYHESHSRGRIIGGACWDLRNDIGQNNVDDLVYDVVDNYSIYGDTFEDFIDDILTADDDDANIYNGTPNHEEIFDAFNDDHYVLGRIVSGTIYRDMTWEDDIIVLGDITVPSGITLTINSGVAVSFAAMDAESAGTSSTKSELIVNGTLKADDAAFSAVSKGDWYGIVFNSGASSSSYLDGCTIENAYNAVTIDGSDPTIDDCEIRYADVRGVYIKGSGAQPTIKYCYIHDTDNEALYVYDDADPDVFENKLYAKFGAGAAVYSADGLFCGNEFRTASGGYGVTVSGSSSRPEFNEDYYQGNKWDMSDISWSKAVYIYGGYPKFGDHPVHTGANDFINIGTNEYYIWNSTGNTILAESNYWGALAPNSAWFYGSVDRTPYESSSQNAGPSWKQSADNYFPAVAAYDKGDFKEALSLCETLLKTEPEHERIAEIAFLFGKSAQKVGALGEKLSVLNEFVNQHDNPEVAHVDRVWASYYYASTGNMDKSRSTCLAAPEGSLSERELLLSLIGYYRSNDDERGAQEIAAMLRTKRKNDADLETDIGDMLNSPKLSLNSTTLPKPSASQASTTPDQFALYPAFPNPFNPATTILFDLPKETGVSLEIVDILGRQVRLLVDQQMEAGSHIVPWDGRSSHGTEAAAGIYFARLRTEEKTRTIKMVLVR